MSLSADATALLDKAERAIASSRLLLADGNLDGACDRAYYVMFDAVRAVLLTESKHPPGRRKLTASSSLHLACITRSDTAFVQKIAPP